MLAHNARRVCEVGVQKTCFVEISRWRNRGSAFIPDETTIFSHPFFFLTNIGSKPSRLQGDCGNYRD